MTSSVVVYDASVQTERVTEDHPAAPRTIYAATKRSAELLGAAVAHGRASLKRRWPGRQELLYAEDAAGALVAAGFVTAPRHDTFNIGSGEPVTVAELAAAIGAAAGRALIEVVDPGADANPDVIDAPLDLSRAADELDWRPSYDLRRGLAEHVAWLRSAERSRA